MTEEQYIDEEGPLARHVPDYYREDDPHLGWVYRPHSITFLFICVGLLLYYAVFRQEQGDFSSNVKVGVIGTCLVFLLFSMLQFRDGLFRRPHPAVWRVVMGMAVLYMIFQVFILFQTVDDARMLLHFWDANLGVPLPERSYAEDCRLYTPENPESLFYNLKNTIVDEFIWAHFFGWWLKTIMIRDWYLCWTLSIVFELLELSLRHLLHNFNECWWDHIILDVLVCNGLGIYMGMKTCEVFSVKQYDWAGVAASPTRPESAKPGGGPRRPRRGSALGSVVSSGRRVLVPQYDAFQWEFLSSPRRLLSVLFICLLVMLVDLNAFFIKFVLWIPPPHHLVLGRLFLWFLIGLPALRELYQFITDSSCKKLGTMAWLGCANCGIEVLVWLKFGKGMFPAPWPPMVLWTWGTGIVVATIWCTIFFILKARKEKQQRPKDSAETNKKES